MHLQIYGISPRSGIKLALKKKNQNLGLEYLRLLLFLVFIINVVFCLTEDRFLDSSPHLNEYGYKQVPNL